MSPAYLEFKEEAAKGEATEKRESKRENKDTWRKKGMQRREQGGGGGRAERDAGIPDKEV